MVRQLTVDGEMFRVQLHDDGGFDCEWLSGPNPGYGFGVGAPAGYIRRSAEEAAATDAVRTQLRDSDARVIDSIRTFLAMVDPDTGYIGD